MLASVSKKFLLPLIRNVNEFKKGKEPFPSSRGHSFPTCGGSGGEADVGGFHICEEA